MLTGKEFRQEFIYAIQELADKMRGLCGLPPKYKKPSSLHSSSSMHSVSNGTASSISVGVNKA